MACFGNADAKARSQAIERLLRKEDGNYKREVKLLLLGTGESGKSTIVKQMQIIYGKGFNDGDRAAFRPLVHRNMHTSMKNMLDAMYSQSMELTDQSLTDASYELLDMRSEDFDMTKYKDLLLKLWNDPSVKAIFLRRNEYQLSDSTEYFFNSAARITDPGYIPDEQDVLRARQPTTGIHEFTFDLQRVVFRMLDVGGQRSERRKWIHCFENIMSIIFIVASSEYDQTLFEEPDCNRMKESIALFAQVINYEWFKQTSFILFLNKSDLLDEKIKKSYIKDFFPEPATRYDEMARKVVNVNPPNPPGVHDGAAFKEYSDCTREFILTMYLHETPEKKDVYPHWTTATDTGTIKFVFEAVHSKILKNNLVQYNLF